MQMKWLAVLALGGFAAAAGAHHSFAMFNMTKDVTVQGMVTDFKWTNPHAWMHVEVGSTSYALEMTSPNNLVHSGWRRSAFKAGDKVTVTYHPLVNGKPGGALVRAVLPDGKILENK